MRIARQGFIWNYFRWVGGRSRCHDDTKATDRAERKKRGEGGRKHEEKIRKTNSLNFFQSLLKLPSQLELPVSPTQALVSLGVKA